MKIWSVLKKIDAELDEWRIIRINQKGCSERLLAKNGESKICSPEGLVSETFGWKRSLAERGGIELMRF